MRAGAAAAAPRGRRLPCRTARAARAGAIASARIDEEEDEDEQRADARLAPGHDPPRRAAQGGRRRSRAQRERPARRLWRQRQQQRRRRREHRDRGTGAREAAHGRRSAHRVDRRRGEGHDRRPPADDRPGHHAAVEPVRVAGRPHAGFRRAPDARGRVDRARRQQARRVDRAPQGRRRVPQRQDRRRRRRDLLAEADHRPEGPEGRQLVDQLHRPRQPEEDRRADRAHPAQAHERGLRGRSRPVLQRDRPHGLRPQEAGRHGAVQVPVVLTRPAQRLRQEPELLADRAAVRRPADDHRLPRRHGAHERPARRAGRGDQQPARGPARQHPGQPEPEGAELADRRVAAVHDAHRRRAVRRRQGPPGDAAHRRPRADGPAGPQRPGLGRQRPVRPLRPDVRERPAAAQAGPRAGQVAAQAGRQGGPLGRARHLAGVQRHRRGGAGVRRAGQGRRREREGPQGRHGHVLRRQLPQVAVRPGLLGLPRLPRPGRPGRPAQLAVQRDPLGQGQVRVADQPGARHGRRGQAQGDPARGPADAVRAGRLHHPVLLEHHRRVQREDRRLRPGEVGLPVRELLAEERRLRRRAPDRPARRPPARQAAAPARAAEVPNESTPSRPRLATSLPTIRRWISEVPSQIRSTRRSR